MKNKKLVIGFILGILLIGLCSSTFQYGATHVSVKTVVEDGHKYVVATTTCNGMVRPGGVSIIHSEACPCKNHIKK